MNILDGTDEIICNKINEITGGHKWFGTKTTLLEVSKICPSDIDLTALIRTLYQKIESNWKNGGQLGSNENWRWSLKRNIDPENKSAEIRIERAFANILSPEHWANQIPVASGLVGSADGRRNIDLAHWDGVRTVTLIELKVASDTPIYAAFEIVRYALLLCLAREHTEIRMAKPLWKEVSLARLRVVAPTAYYQRDGKPLSLGWIEHAIDRAVAAFGETLPESAKLTMDFGFRAYSSEPHNNEKLLVELLAFPQFLK